MVRHSKGRGETLSAASPSKSKTAAAAAAATTQTATSKGKKKAGRRRRNRRDVILDFRKHVQKKVNVCQQSGGANNHELGSLPTGGPTGGKRKRAKNKEKITRDSAMELAKIAQSRVAKVASEYEPRKERPKRGNKSNRFALLTGSKDYEGNLGLPEEVAQREYESTGQFFRRLDRLVAKARVEANLESRFDIKLGRHDGSDKTSVARGETKSDIITTAKRKRTKD